MTTKTEKALVLNVVSLEHAKASLSYNEVKSMIDKQVDIVKNLEVSDSMTADIALNAIKHLNNILSQVEKQRAFTKKPYIVAGKLIDTAAKALTDQATEVIVLGKKLLADFKKTEDMQKELLLEAARKKAQEEQEALAKEASRKQAIQEQITVHELKAIAAITNAKTIAELATVNEEFILNSVPLKDVDFEQERIKSLERIKEIGRSRVKTIQELVKAQDAKSKEAAIAKEKAELEKVTQLTQKIKQDAENQKEQEQQHLQEKIYLQQMELQAQNSSINLTASNINTRKSGWDYAVNPAIKINEVTEQFLEVDDSKVKAWIKAQREKGAFDAAVKAGKLKHVDGIEAPCLVYGGLCFFEKDEVVVLR